MAATALWSRWGTRRDLGGEGKYLREEGGLTRTRSRGEGSSLSLALPRRGAASRSGGDRRHGRSVARTVKTTREGELGGLGRPGGLRPRGRGGQLGQSAQLRGGGLFLFLLLQTVFFFCFSFYLLIERERGLIGQLFHLGKIWEESH